MQMRRVGWVVPFFIFFVGHSLARGAPIADVCASIHSAADLANRRKTALQAMTTEATFCPDCSASDNSGEIIANMVKPKNPQARKFLACLTEQLAKQQKTAARENEFLLNKITRLKIESLEASQIPSLIQRMNPKDAMSLDSKDPRRAELLTALTGVQEGTRISRYAVSLSQTYNFKKPLPGGEILADFQDALRGYDKRSEYHPDGQQPALTPWVAKQILIALALEKIPSPSEKASFLKNFSAPVELEKNNQNIFQACLSSVLHVPVAPLSPHALFESTAVTVPLQKKLKPKPTTCEFEWAPGDLVTTAEHTFVVLGYSARKDGGVDFNTVEIPGRNARDFNVVKRDLYANTNPTCKALNLDEPGTPSRAVVWNWQD